MIVEERLRPEVFRLPVEKIRAGYKSDTYFNRTRAVLERDHHKVRVTMQVFQKARGVTVVGADQSLAILRVGTGNYRDPKKANTLFQRYLSVEREMYRSWLNLGHATWEEYLKVSRPLFEVSQELAQLWVDGFEQLKIWSLYDGELANPYEPVMHIEGDYATFAHLETPYLGALSDGTCVATNTRRVVEAAGRKPILMFGARHQGHEAQASSGYAAYVGGAKGVSTDEQGEWWGSKGLGTMPHALIAAYDGDTVLATIKFAETVGPSVNVTTLVDFDNDCVTTAVAVAKALGGKLWGVRLDTAENLMDRSIYEAIMHGGSPADGRTMGVIPQLVQNVRRALNNEGFPHVKITASGGFTAERIRQFEEQLVPVDAYGVGSELLRNDGGRYDFTADIVQVEGLPVSKKGRAYQPSARLHPVSLLHLSA